MASRGAAAVALNAVATFDLNLDASGQLWSTNAGAGPAHDLTTAYPTTSAGAVSLTLLTATATTGIVAQSSTTVWFTGYTTGLSLITGSGSSWARPSSGSFSAALKVTWAANNGVPASTVVAGIGCRGLAGWTDSSGSFILYLLTIGNLTSGTGNNVLLSFNATAYAANTAYKTFVAVAAAPYGMDFRGEAAG